MSCYDHKGKNCVCEVLRAIKDIQDNAVDNDCRECTTNCFLEPLGGLAAPSRRRNADTRVFSLYTKNGDLFKAFYRDRDRDGGCTSVFFRVEDIFDGCCATLRVLRPYRDDVEVDLLNNAGTQVDHTSLCGVDGFRRSNSCITVDLSCFCAVQCIADVDLDICD